MKKVLLTDNISEEALAVFASYENIEAVRTGTLDKAELATMLPEYDAVIVRSPTKLTKDLIAAGKKLKFIGRAGVGVDNIDVEEATRRGITVMNSPGGNSISTAEHAIALLLAVARRVVQADRMVRAGEWRRDALKGRELYGKTAGIIGLGRVGREVARRLLAFSMRILATDPYITPEAAKSMGVGLVDLDTLFRESHAVTVHVPLVDETRALISDTEIAKMREGVFIVNCSRGGVVDEGALQRGLDSGRVAGVGLDVYATEPPGDHPLLEHERSVFTPHLGAATREAQVRVAVEVAKNVADALDSGKITDAVNRPWAGEKTERRLDIS
jgi:D-3-phosphoglycerate dehydrogenase